MTERRGVIADKGAAAVETQCVLAEPAVWATDAYRDFFNVRRGAPAQRFNTFNRDKSGA